MSTRQWTDEPTPVADESLGLRYAPGDDHYRAYVGPPRDFDLVAAMSFGLLVNLGLRQHHKVLDIGCGALRVGRLLLPYLNRGGYAGIEPNRWLVEQGIAREVGRDQIALKMPRFEFSEDASALVQHGVRFDYALAQSIFSHCGHDLLDNWLRQASALLDDAGVLVATFLDGPDNGLNGWIYPDCVTFSERTLIEAAERHGLEFAPLRWHHPRQRWALFGKPGFPVDRFRDQPLSWNACFDFLDQRAQSADG